VRSIKKISKPDHQNSAVHISSCEQPNPAEQFYRFLFENNPFPAWIYNTETLKFLEVNLAALDFYGYSKEEFFSMIFDDIEANEEMTSVEEIAEATSGNKTGEHIFKHRKKNGDEVYVEVRANDFIYNDQMARLVMITDVTAVINAEISLKKTNEEYRLANERYDIVSNATHDLIWDWNLESNEVYRDPKGLWKVYGATNNEDIKHINDWLERVHDDDLPRVQNVILKIVNAKDENIFE